MPPYDGYQEDALYHYPNGNLAFLVDLDSDDTLPASLTAESNCVNLGHIEKDGANAEEDFTNLKVFKNNLNREVGAKVDDSSGTITLNLLQKNKGLVAYLKAKTGVTKMLMGLYMGIIQSEHHWIFAIVRNGTKIKQGSKDEATEFIGKCVANASAITFTSGDLEAIETALAIAIHPTSVTIDADAYTEDTYTAVT